MAASAARAQRPMTRMDKATRGLGAAAAMVGRQMAGMIATFGGIFAIRRVVGLMASFEETMAQVRAVTRSTEEEFAKLNDTARELGATTRFSAEQAAEGMLALSRAGLNAEEANKAIASSLNLAVAGAIDLGRAAEITASSMAQFGLDASEAERIADVLIMTSNNTMTNVDQLAQAMSFAGTVANFMGASIEETAATMGVLADKAIQATRGGTNIRAILQKMVSPAEEAKVALEAVGIEADSINPIVVGMIPAIENLSKAMRQMSDVEAAQTAEALFGLRNVAAFFAVGVPDAIEKIKELVELNEQASGAAAEFARVVDDTLKGSLLSLKSAVEELILATGDTGFRGTLRDIIDTATLMVRILAGVRIEYDQLTENQRRLVRTAEILAKIVEAVAKAFATLIALKIVFWFVGLAKAILFATLSLKGLWAAFMANPLGMIAQAIALIVGAFILLKDVSVTWGQQQTTLGDLVIAIWETATRRLSFLFKGFADAAKASWEIIRFLAISVWEAIKATWNVAVDFFSGIWNGIKSAFQAFSALLRGDWDAVWEHVKGAVEGFVNAFDAIFIEPIKAAFETFFGWVRDALEWLGLIEEETADTLRASGSSLSRGLVQRGMIAAQGIGDTALNEEALREEGARVFGTLGDMLREEIATSTEEGLSEGLEQGIQEQILNLRGTMGDAFQLPITDMLEDLPDFTQELELASDAILNTMTWGEEIEHRLAVATAQRALAQDDAADSADDYRNALENLNNSIQNLQGAEKESVADIIAAQRAREQARQNIQEMREALRAQRQELEMGAEAFERWNTIAEFSKNIKLAILDPDLRRQRLDEFLAQYDELLNLQKTQEATDFVEGARNALDEQLRISEIGAEAAAREAQMLELRSNLMIKFAGDVEQVNTVLQQFEEDIDTALINQKWQEFGETISQTVNTALADLTWNLLEVTAAFAAGNASGKDFLQTVFNIANQAATGIAQQGLQTLFTGLFADGGAFSGGRVIPFANGGVVASPAAFPMQGGVGLMGESGPEAIMPLERTADGSLGVRAEGAQAPVTINMTINTPDADSFRRSQGQIVGDMRSAMLRTPRRG